MLKKTAYAHLFPMVGGIAVVLLMLSVPLPAAAEDPVPAPNNGNCILCHEDLYYLHDTGNWFCLNESPMACVDCHGGNPGTLDKELAHARRAAHPIINEDVDKCRQCHPDECYDRVELFDQKAGISDVLVAIAFTPAYSTDYTGAGSAEEPQPNLDIIMFQEFIPIVLVAGLAVAIFLILHNWRKPS